MGRIKKILFIISILFSTLSLSQHKIKGNVKDNEGKILNSASIILKDNNNKIIKFTYTDNLGDYSIQTEIEGTFTLSVNSMGFEKKSTDITIDNTNENKTVDFILTPKTTELKEIILETTRPITIEGDKIIFDAKSFAQGNEQVVEDLLKKIPGLNIDANGTIKVGNQEVEKVMPAFMPDR